MTLIELLSEHAEEIIKEVLQGVERSRGHSVPPSGNDQTRLRVKALFVLTARAIREKNLSPMLAHAEELARERYAAGTDLLELHVVFDVLEEVLWRRIRSSVAPTDYAEAFGLVGTVLSAGKQALARTYATLASKSKAPSLDLAHLFDGSESI